jgi:hypothetical protein
MMFMLPRHEASSVIAMSGVDVLLQGGRVTHSIATPPQLNASGSPAAVQHSSPAGSDAHVQQDLDDARLQIEMLTGIDIARAAVTELLCWGCSQPSNMTRAIGHPASVVCATAVAYSISHLQFHAPSSVQWTSGTPLGTWSSR